MYDITITYAEIEQMREEIIDVNSVLKSQPSHPLGWFAALHSVGGCLGERGSDWARWVGLLAPFCFWNYFCLCLNYKKCLINEL